MADSRVDREEVETLAEILIEKGLTEIEYEDAAIRIRVSRAGLAVAPAVAQGAGPGRSDAGPPASADSGGPPDGESIQEIKSPMVGTFYLAPSPESPSFVEVGDHVRKGQVVCIIEAMKLMNEIESEFEGVVAERLAENAQGVEFDQPLFRIAAN
jgi:acetyl-CoA carboxylase biotin carboxyl carrier protein